MFIGKHIFIIFLSLSVIRNFRSVFLNVAGIIPLEGDFEGQGGHKTKGGYRWETAQTGQKCSTTI